MMSVLIGVLSVILIGTGLLYFLATTVYGMIESQRLRRRETAAGPRPVATSARPEAVYYLVPCLNEEAVIGTTVSRLLVDEEVRVVVIDDASEDRTADVVHAVGGDRTLLLSRRLPNARKGKGPALNAGLAVVVADAKARGLDPSLVLVGVMDADGYLSVGAMAHILPLFDKPVIGGAQLGVRISNRDTNLLTTMQDFEFWGMAATAQMGRAKLGTVSLGGNGQFTRLSALCSLRGDPWSDALTEDLDLALRLMQAGWQLTTTSQAAVYQEGVVTLKSLIRQRTRWYQGHMTCIKMLRRMWGSPALSNLAVLEVSAYLLIPWIFILPWSILFHIGLWELLGRLGNAGGSFGNSGVLVAAITLIAWYLLGFGPSLFGGFLYHRQDRSVGRLRAVVLGHALLLCNYIAFVSCWLAALRSLRGLTGWEKTVRHSEADLDGLVPYQSAGRNAPPRLSGRLRPSKRVVPPVTQVVGPTLERASSGEATVLVAPSAAATAAAVLEWPIALGECRSGASLGLGEPSAASQIGLPTPVETVAPTPPAPVSVRAQPFVPSPAAAVTVRLNASVRPLPTRAARTPRRASRLTDQEPTGLGLFPLGDASRPAPAQSAPAPTPTAVAPAEVAPPDASRSVEGANPPSRLTIRVTPPGAEGSARPTSHTRVPSRATAVFSLPVRLAVPPVADCLPLPPVAPTLPDRGRGAAPVEAPVVPPLPPLPPLLTGRLQLGARKPERPAIGARFLVQVGAGSEKAVPDSPVAEPAAR